MNLEVKHGRTSHFNKDVFLGSEEQVEILDKILSTKISSQGKLFAPGDDFYSLTLNEMADQMLGFIGISRGNDNLQILLDSSISYPGLYFQKDNVHYILIKREHAKSAIQCAAILAHELMHYVLIGGLHYRLNKRIDNEKLTDMATIYTGLGLVVLNGFEHEGNNWAITAALLALGVLHYRSRSLVFGYYNAKDYAGLVSDYIKSYKVPSSKYAGFVLPGSSHFLPTTTRGHVVAAKNKTEVVRNAIKARWIKRGIESGIAIAIVVVVVIISNLSNSGSSTGSNTNGSSTVSPQVQQKLQALQNTTNSYKSQYSSCENQLSSIQNQLSQTNQTLTTYSDDNDTNDYNNLVPTQNQEVSEYKSQYNNCQTLYSEVNDAVNSYNNYLKQQQ